MKRLRIANHLIKNTTSLCDSALQEHLHYVRIEDDGRVFAVFTDNSVIDISELYPQAVLDDYSEHHILESC